MIGKIFTAMLLGVFIAGAAPVDVAANRQLFHERIQGENLALGKEVIIIPKPDYRLTTDGNDSHDLTDGRISRGSTDKIWFDKGAIGWSGGDSVKYFKIDLGKVEPLGKLVFRCLGGTQGSFKYPLKFEVYVSRDDQLYYATNTLQKLMPGESAQSDFVNYYYLPEDRTRYDTSVYPFEFAVDAHARYVILQVTGATTMVFSDELAIVKSAKPVSDAAYSRQNSGIVIPMSGLIVRPRIGELAIMKDLPAPQSFIVSDLRPPAERREYPGFVWLDLPEGVSILGQNPTESRTIGGHSYKRYRLKLGQEIFLAASADPIAAPAYLCGADARREYHGSTLPISILHAPEIAPFQRLSLSLAWMLEHKAAAWPNFWANWRKLGFNAVSTFPRYWTTPGLRQAGTKFVDTARENKFAVIMNEGTLWDKVAGKNPDASEIYCQIPGKPDYKKFCPSYHGKYYDLELARIAENVRLSRPDQVFFDIECWHHAVDSAPQCTRCQAAAKASGMSLTDHLYRCGTRQQADMKAAVARGAQAAGIPMPILGSYNRQPRSGGIYAIEVFSKIYPESIDLAMPSLYVSGDGAAVHENILDNHRLLGNKKLIPWLSAGTYGEFDSVKLEAMVLESLLNGAGGITYYDYGSFTDSPRDFYHHLQALAMLRPYEGLVADGEVALVSGSNPALYYSLLKKGPEALLLVGNYRNSSSATAIKLPFDAISEIRDLRPGSESGVDLNRLRVPKGGFRLLYIR